ncbi:hypothetical protein Bbelb_281370 [Branchiostoma belcheri]|nr:hypothetical protein Bbelb_281370 [Branchiostoma belcheri]
MKAHNRDLFKERSFPGAESNIALNRIGRRSVVEVKVAGSTGYESEYLRREILPGQGTESAGKLAGKGHGYVRSQGRVAVKFCKVCRDGTRKATRRAVVAYQSQGTVQCLDVIS